MMAMATLFMTSCQLNETDRPASIGDGFTLMGYSDVQTKTAFGTPDASTIPFLWSEGDKVMVNGVESEPLSSSSATAHFIFNSGTVNAGDGVYYGVTKDGSKIYATVSSEQSGLSDELGENGDFGYAVVEDDMTFTLSHKSSYLWLNPYTTDLLSGVKVKRVDIEAANNIVGKSEITSGGELGSVTDGSKKISLNFDNPRSIPSASFDTDIWAVAVVLPGNTGAVTIDYILDDGGVTKKVTFEISSKELQPGNTYRVTNHIQSANIVEYELRVLTFEDEGSSTYWSGLIPAENEQAYGVSSMIYGEGYSGLSQPYAWSDPFTQLSHSFPYNYDMYSFMGGGHVISTHQGTMSDLQSATDIYSYQLSIPLATGHNGSDNFCVGYHDSNVNLEDDVKPALVFSDGQARVIDHMYVTNASVTMYCISFGNSFSNAYGEEDYLDIVATGYNGDTKGETIRFRLAAGADYKVDEWTRWDLSSLGAVTKVVFSMDEAQKDDWGYGVFYKTPMYFAYDDVAVRFPVE